jgi:tetraprenyl-beta-curcumene synthase
VAAETGALNRRLAARAALSLALAGVRYCGTVAPVVQLQLAHWRRRALAIPEPRLRALALGKLADERFNAEAGAMLATLAPRAHRGDAVQAIVALQVLFDLLDGLTEQPSRDPLLDGERLFAAFTDALGPPSQHRPPGGGAADGYLQELSAAAGGALMRLPARASVIEVAAACAQRAAQAQIRMHAAPALGIGQLRDWAQTQARGTALEWRELAAGAASSVLVLHALIAAAADVETTPEQVAGIEHAYLSICVLLTLLDGVIDEQRDERSGEQGYVSLYPDRELLAQTLFEAARRAARQSRALAHGGHHVTMLTGVVAYYTSAPDARDARVRPLAARLHRDLAPAIAPSLAFMRAWRLVRRLRAQQG